MSLAPEILVAAAAKISTPLDVSRQNFAFESHRVNNFLDALAAVCVQRVKGEGYAVTLQLHQSTGATLFIAGNEDVPESVEWHIYHIWSLLSKITSQLAESHKLLGQSSDSNEPPPPTAAPSQDRTAAEVSELRNILYSNSLKKVTSRVSKRFVEFVRFVEKLETHYDQRPLITDDRERQAFTCLKTASQYIRTIHSALLGPGSVDIANLATSMSLIDSEVVIVLKTPDPVLIKWSGVERFPLHRYIKKVVAIETHIKELLGVTKSPNFRQHFRRKVDIIRIPGAVSNVTVPANVEQLIGETFKGDYEVTPNPDVLAGFGNLFRNLVKTRGNPFRAHVHCECNLVGYLRSLPSSPSPPMRYLGTSKLSCKACAIYIKACNTTRAGGRHTIFTIRGTNRKWYSPWGFPASNDSVVATFRGLMEDEIAEFLEARQLSISRTTSSDASSSNDDSDRTRETYWNDHYHELGYDGIL